MMQKSTESFSEGYGMIALLYAMICLDSMQNIFLLYLSVHDNNKSVPMQTFRLIA